MADQAINALPTKTSPTTGDKMLMIGSAEEYQIDYDQLADAILNKLTSKTYTLDQGTKSFVAALNELNSKRINSFIPSDIYDLNNPPDYFMFKVLAGSTHIPKGMGNQFLVFRVVLDNDIYDAMLAIGFGGNRIALNTKNGSSAWGGWKYATFH